MGHLVRLEPREALPENLASLLFSRSRRVLVFGAPGSGKSTLVAGLSRELTKAGHRASGIDADPGSPAFGIPGAVCSGAWRTGEWQLLRLEALCTLDAARFRLPLVSAVRRLARSKDEDTLLLDAPGVSRGVAGSELLFELVEAAAIDTVIAIARSSGDLPLSAELEACGAQAFIVPASPQARLLSTEVRALHRTERWDAYLKDGVEYSIDTRSLEIVGTPPPPGTAGAWRGRQVALLQASSTTSLGEVVGADGDMLRLRIRAPSEEARVLLVRNARRDRQGHLRTAAPYPSRPAPATAALPSPPHVSSAPAASTPVRLAGARAALLNGPFGDPVLFLHFLHEKRCLLFDLGDITRLPARLAHQVTDIFLSHAHMDHIIGFLPLVRLRIGDFPSCRIFGPPGIAGHIEALLRGIEWDRVGSLGPRFRIAELRGCRLLCFQLRSGDGALELLEEKRLQDGVLLQEPAFRIRATTLDHGTPVLAYALEQSKQIKVRKDRLKALNLEPGPWLRELKQRIACGERNVLVRLPYGRMKRAGTLAEELILTAPGQKLVYATDFADTRENRSRLVAMARSADALFCEASFLEDDREQAASTGHLTAKACGEIAAAARVRHLIPFHFSKRYEGFVEPIYEQVRSGTTGMANAIIIQG